MGTRDGRAGAGITEAGRHQLPDFTNDGCLHRSVGRSHRAKKVTNRAVLVVTLARDTQAGVSGLVSANPDDPVRVIVELVGVAQPRHAEAADKCGEQDDGNRAAGSHGTHRTLGDFGRERQDHRCDRDEPGARRRLISAQLMTFQNAARYSGRRL